MPGLDERGHHRQLGRQAALLAPGRPSRRRSAPRRVVARVGVRAPRQVDRGAAAARGGAARLRGARPAAPSAARRPSGTPASRSPGARPRRGGLGLDAPSGTPASPALGLRRSRGRRRAGGGGRRGAAAAAGAAGAAPAGAGAAGGAAAARRRRGGVAGGGFQSGVIGSLKPMCRWFWCAASVKKPGPAIANGEPISFGRIAGRARTARVADLARGGLPGLTISPSIAAMSTPRPKWWFETEPRRR